MLLRHDICLQSGHLSQHRSSPQVSSRLVCRLTAVNLVGDSQLVQGGPLEAVSIAIH